MTPEAFRQLVLADREVEEGMHQGHPDFRLDGRVVATLGYPDVGWAMVKVGAEDQEILLSSEPTHFQPAPGTWGRQGSTLVRLEALDEKTARSAINMALLLARRSGIR